MKSPQYLCRPGALGGHGRITVAILPDAVPTSVDSSSTCSVWELGQLWRRDGKHLQLCRWYVPK